MADVSDGLLIDAQRIAAASGCGMELALDTVPLSTAFVAARGDTLTSRLFAVTSGDDYRLVFAMDPARCADLPDLGSPLIRVGTCLAGEGLRLSHNGAPVPLPPRLGYMHGEPPLS